MTDNTAPLSVLTDLIAKAKTKGADAADAVLVNSVSVSVAYRLGALEKLERSENADIGLRVLIGKRQAIVSSSERNPAALDALVERAVAMARAVPDDPYCGLADPADIVKSLPDIDICDPFEPSADKLVEMAHAAEDAARAVEGVTNSEGSEAAWGRAVVAVAGTNGVAFSYSSSGVSLSVSVLAAGSSGEMERDYDFTAAVYLSDLRTPEDIGRTAGMGAVRRLGSRKVATQAAPVIFAPRVARGLLSHLIGAINGAGVARGTSFLKDHLGKVIFPSAITIVDDPLRRRGLRSKPCDGEGIATQRRNLIDSGILTTWLLDLRSAHQLGLRSTGHAARGTTSPPSPSATNVYLEPGIISVADLIKDVQSGLYVTELFGMGVNPVTGDYSRGASGLWIENGILTYPVSEVTVAGNLKDMFAHLTAADDLEFRYGVDSPTVRVDGLTIAGK